MMSSDDTNNAVSSSEDDDPHNIYSRFVANQQLMFTTALSEILNVILPRFAVMY